MLIIERMILGPVQTNAYLIHDPQTQTTVAIDPAWEGEKIAAFAEQNRWKISQVWLTHAHFDHFGGVSGILKSTSPPPLVALHPSDLPLWRAQGGAQFFGFRVESPPEPNLYLRHGQVLRVGEYEVEVRHAPGHTPGHVVFYIPQAEVCFCGDVIFESGIGRTDLPGGDFETLMNSIREQILTLPDQTRLLSGHGEETTVAQERHHNPWLHW
ncbi:MAG: MBL fold metallo-hydrolase [Anaerolineales bacterium]|nr:MBL fold metallo-hydrolase [Anaerolineales bacterium]MCS7246681.1 MBL fold metallo-hydrolase [Anaerolineales bacterium]MDW8160491.1 MBL fold metallo-hydrolase [Anaerolineales bacterium]MDW8446194.1 MBL fold metallo-hydrolase [Anaerolineales bacterium]